MTNKDQSKNRDLININMKKFFSVALGAVCMFGITSCDNPSGETKSANPKNDSLAMARGCVMGTQMGQQLMYASMQGNPIDTVEFLKGFKEGLAKAADSKMYGFYAGQITGHQMGENQIKDQVNVDLFYKYFEASLKGDSTLTKDWTPEEAMQYLEVEEPKVEKRRLEAEFGENKKAGEEFLVNFKKEEGVQVTESGIAYKVLKEGEGVKPTTDSRVKVNYVGTLVDGKEFDRSKDEPVEFGVTQVIPGWTEMLLLMNVGEKVKVVIPENLAYGTRDMGDIKPFSTLVFEVELVEVLAPAAE